MKQRNKRSCTITVSLYALYVYLLFHRENIFMNLMKMNFLEILKERERKKKLKIKIAKIDDIFFFFFFQRSRQIFDQNLAIVRF